MEIHDAVKNWNTRCSQCGDCRVFKNIFLPSCPPGHRFKYNSYYAIGRMMIGRGLMEGTLSIEDDDVLERIFTCSACRACDVNCGNLARGHIDDVIKGLRQMAVSAGAILPGHMIMIDSLKKNDNVLEKDKKERGKWAEGLKLKNIHTERAEIAYRIGCLLSFDPEMNSVARDTLSLLQQANVDFGIEGADEICCGGRAFEIGNVAEFSKYAEHNIEAYNSTGVRTVVTSCADGFSHFRLLYPQLEKDMKFNVLHIVEYIDQLVKRGALRFTVEIPIRVTYHDPCHLGRYAGIYEPPREILKSVPGLELVEMERNREFGWCCGAGAGVKQAFPTFSLWTAKERLTEAMDTGAAALVTCCPWCEKNFKDAAKSFGAQIDILDIAEIVRRAVKP